MKNKTKYWLAFFVLLLHFSAYSQECDCDISPREDQCNRVCDSLLEILRAGTEKQLKDKLNLDSVGIQRIMRIPNRSAISTVAEFNSYLQQNNYAILKRTYNSWIIVDKINVSPTIYNATNNGIVEGDFVNGPKNSFILGDKIKVKGNRNNAFLSMLLPGWGDIYVNRYSNSNNKKFSAVCISGLFVTSGSLFLYFYQKKVHYYDQYHNAGLNQNNIDKYYQAANRNYHYAGACLLVVVGTYAFDVLHVYRKGRSNEKNKMANHAKEISHYKFGEPRYDFCLNAANNCIEFGICRKL
jgi:hypothetical protein